MWADVAEAAARARRTEEAKQGIVMEGMESVCLWWRREGGREEGVDRQGVLEKGSEVEKKREVRARAWGEVDVRRTKETRTERTDFFSIETRVQE
jgi:hypothetical protein